MIGLNNFATKVEAETVTGLRVRFGALVSTAQEMQKAPQEVCEEFNNPHLNGQLFPASVVAARVRSAFGWR